MNLKLSILFTLLGSAILWAQTDSLYVEIDTTVQWETQPNKLINSTAMAAFWTKLQKNSLQKNGKISIVHVGDSHIQADLFSGYFRRKLQEQFGNAGRGFVFPHSLAKTNGIDEVRFSSLSVWESQRNIYPDTGAPVGLSGFALFTRSIDCAIEVQIRKTEAAFHTLKIITPQNQRMFDVALQAQSVTVETEVQQPQVHKIKNGESLSVIADKYNVSVKALKAANGLKNNNIRAGKSLQIPVNQTVKKATQRWEYNRIAPVLKEGYHEFTSDTLQHRIFLLPHAEAASYALNGLVLENKNSGLIYHTIGVNGAKFSDYNKYALFFEQIKVLQPDLIVVSLGTNESFDKLISTEYITQLNVFLERVRKEVPQTAFLITTPPPSLFKRKFPNTFVADYTQEILKQAEVQNYAVWDMFSQLGGLFGMKEAVKQGWIGADRVHYTKAGYEKQGQLLTDAFLEAFQLFNSENGK